MIFEKILHPASNILKHYEKSYILFIVAQVTHMGVVLLVSIGSANLWSFLRVINVLTFAIKVPQKW